MTDQDELQQLRQQNAALAAALKQTQAWLDHQQAAHEAFSLNDMAKFSMLAIRKTRVDEELEVALLNVDYHAILSAHDADVRQKTLLDEWEHDWPVIFATIADEPDERLAPDAQTTKQAILEAIEKSGWLKQHDAAVRKPLLEALRNLLSYWSEACGDSEDCDRYAGRIDQIDSLLSRYNDDGSER